MANSKQKIVNSITDFYNGLKGLPLSKINLDDVFNILKFKFKTPLEGLNYIRTLKSYITLLEDKFVNYMEYYNSNKNKEEFIKALEDKDEIISHDINFMNLKDFLSSVDTDDLILDTRNKFLWKASTEIDDGLDYFVVAQGYEDLKNFPEYTKAPFELWEDALAEHTIYPNLKAIKKQRTA